jgi:predicted outer membrane repeat protein
MVFLLFLALPVCDAAVIHVPGDQPTIQAGINAAGPGDTVLVAAGTYYDCTHLDPDGYLNCVILKSGICLQSETGEADCVTIDAQGIGRVFYCLNIENTTIEGFTITGGLAVGSPPHDRGGGMYCYFSSPNIRNCEFLDNHSSMWAGGLFCRRSSPTVEHVVFRSNSADFYGGGMAVQENAFPSVVDCIFEANEAPNGGAVYLIGTPLGTPEFTGVVFSANSANYGGGLYSQYCDCVLSSCVLSSNSAHSGGALHFNHCSPSVVQATIVGNSGINGAGLHCRASDSFASLENTIIAFSTQGTAVHCHAEGSATLTCCDVYGNNGGDWVGCIADQLGVNGNFSEDPLFCTDCYALQDCSPCVDGYGCGQVGAYGPACPCGGGPSNVDETTWGQVKAQYR